MCPGSNYVTLLIFIRWYCLTSALINETDRYFICGVNESYKQIDEELEPNGRQTYSAIVEIGLFYDQSFYDVFEDNLQNMMRTVLRQVQIIFEYPTMKTPIRLVVTQLNKIETNQVKTDTKLLDYFDKLCWYQFLKYWEKTKPYDLALFFSGATFFSG